MKKLLLLTALLGTMAYGAATTPAPEAAANAATSAVTKEASAVAKEVTKEVKEEAKQEVKKVVKEKGKMMMNHLSADEQAKVKANRAEIMELRKAEKPDWDKIQKLSDENALLGSKAKVEMMKANPNMMFKDGVK